MTHQAKRPYTGSQPSITSYFSASSSPNISSPSPYDGRSPPLPPNVQSNLLSVGMRVRKSVPEGYKTGSSYSAFQLFSDASAPTAVEKPKTRPRAGARELTPFCGILKVGGMAQQQWGIYNSGSVAVEDEEMPFLSSQGSTISDVSVDASRNGGQKRRFFEDEEGEVENGIGGSVLGERVLAVPRRKKWNGKVPDGVKIVGQENAGFGQDMDFEDADFLDYGLVGEVEMSG
ncbi:uncharacterized protein LY89DRAFT_687143 [Mollisia scopiformis]|uniref:Uncharacterized protein n=1 Tax=Mollisia scopiformis TaxID=149040 RepID=A0A194X0R5_MOLSC|nr:uncharacterized protein LY89DRAFT_687143 [Mollisia scopiformis]KUJ13780.1 hypothetical protein LY89DRAFT_687143 [Mollisia scopiformis]